jgi:hypothetical protein
MFPINFVYPKKLDVERMAMVIFLSTAFVFFSIDSGLFADFTKEISIAVFSISLPQQQLQQATAQTGFDLSNKTSIIGNSTASNTSNILDPKLGFESNTRKATGLFIDNQIKSDTISWVQNGTWKLEVKNNNNTNNSKDNADLVAVFDANFTIAKPYENSSYNLSIDNLTTDDVIGHNYDVVVMGRSNIHSDKEIEYTQVPVTVYLLNEKVLNLTIDVNKSSSDNHSNDNNINGTFIIGVGINKSTAKDPKLAENNINNA